ncbi:MAG TPA: hypothetical protein ENN73_05750, partial [Firmicutes bacterium]|nr:hypothetical protein [Bacillota bacterium]
LESSASAAGNKFFEMRIGRCLSRLKDFNMNLTDFFISTNIFPEAALGFIRAGEESGSLDRITKNLSDRFFQEGEHRFRVFFIVFPVVIYLITAIYIASRIITAFSNCFNLTMF